MGNFRAEAHLNLIIACQTLFFKKKVLFIYLYRERGREGERKGERCQCVVASLMPLTRDLTGNPGMCPD